PPALVPLVKHFDSVACQQRETIEKQKRSIEVLQKEQQLAEITLQSFLGRADSEEGQSHSLVHRRAATDSGSVAGTREMIARLTPTFSWLAATPALQKFLGHSIVELNNRSILDFVNKDDVPALKDALEKALRSGEGH